MKKYNEVIKLIENDFTKESLRVLMLSYKRINDMQVDIIT